VFADFVLLVHSTLLSAAPKTKVLVPKNANTPISIMISGKSLKYYPLSDKESLVLTTRVQAN